MGSLEFVCPAMSMVELAEDVEVVVDAVVVVVVEWAFVDASSSRILLSSGRR